MRFSLHLFEFARWVTVLAAGMGSIVGCASHQFVTQRIPDRMKAHADAYRHVGILSLALSRQALTDSSLTTNELERLSRRQGTNLLLALTQAFNHKGCQVTRAGHPLCTAEDWDALAQFAQWWHHYASRSEG